MVVGCYLHTRMYFRCRCLNKLVQILVIHFGSPIVAMDIIYSYWPLYGAYWLEKEKKVFYIAISDEFFN